MPRDKIVTQTLPRVCWGLVHLATDHRITKCRKLRLQITQCQHGGGLPDQTARHPGSANRVAGAPRGQGLAHSLRATASLGLLASAPRSADFPGGSSGATFYGAGRAKSFLRTRVDHGPKERPLPEPGGQYHSLPLPPSIRLRECREGEEAGGYWTRRTGRQESRWENTKSRFSKPTKEGEGTLTSARLLAKTPPHPSASSPLFPYVPNPLPGSQAQDKPLCSPCCYNYQSTS